jgi:YgiT-type zinc finger domain-containing protein
MERELGSFGPEWAELSEQMLNGMHEWRMRHPHAPLQEIESELDQRLAKGRARLLEHLAQQSPATTWDGVQSRAGASAATDLRAGPPCPQCGTPLESRGRKTRRLRTQGDQELVLRRDYGVCPQCGRGLFPPR